MKHMALSIPEGPTLFIQLLLLFLIIIAIIIIINSCIQLEPVNQSKVYIVVLT